MSEQERIETEKPYRTEYAVEVWRDGDFLHQIDVFQSCDDVLDFIENFDEILDEGECLAVIYIDYDEPDIYLDEHEIKSGTMFEVYPDEIEIDYDEICCDEEER